ncbi:MAG TPA: VWA domain-containing protein [Vicinamibacterales bacterium]
MYSRFVVVATLLCGAIAASAQVREQITVEAVDVPVYVVSKGKPVPNLTKDDFELLVNGKPQPIDYFETVDFSEVPPAPALSVESAPLPHSEIRDRRLFLLLFDLLFNRPAAVDRSRRAAIDMVDHALPGDFFAVAMITRNGVFFTIPFLHDRDAIRRAILQLAPSSAHDALAISITNAEREMAEAWVPIAQGGGGRMGNEDPLPDIFAISSPEFLSLELRLETDHVHTIAQIADRLRGLEGYKHVILFSQGPRFLPQFLSTTYPVVDGMASAFQSADAFLHTVDLTLMESGAADPTVMSAGAPGVIPPSANESLLWMSAKTGGKWVHWRNLLAPALQDLSKSFSSAYRLGFKPVNARKGHNDIEVRVKNLPPGAAVSFRKGFSGSAPAKAAPDTLRLADIIQNDTPQTGTPPEISIVGRRIDVVVPVIQLSKQYGAVEGAQVMLYVFNASGVPVVSSQKTFAIPEHAAADNVIQQKLDLVPGNYVAKVLLRAGDSLGFVKKPFEIEAAQPTQ